MKAPLEEMYAASQADIREIDPIKQARAPVWAGELPISLVHALPGVEGKLEVSIAVTPYVLQCWADNLVSREMVFVIGGKITDNDMAMMDRRTIAARRAVAVLRPRRVDFVVRRDIKSIMLMDFESFGRSLERFREAMKSVPVPYGFVFPEDIAEGLCR
ncbi:MAG TPA: hypothetical protein PLH22_02890 [Candidatus Colwellbacteria bacterium]|jgi:hypothetical protein|nr:hypothetical protein [Candidatus Colwellbacteria bacterium]